MVCLCRHPGSILSFLSFCSSFSRGSSPPLFAFRWFVSFIFLSPKFLCFLLLFLSYSPRCLVLNYTRWLSWNFSLLSLSSYLPWSSFIPTLFLSKIIKCQLVWSVLFSRINLKRPKLNVNTNHVQLVIGRLPELDVQLYSIHEEGDFSKDVRLAAQAKGPCHVQHMSDKENPLIHVGNDVQCGKERASNH